MLRHRSTARPDLWQRAKARALPLHGRPAASGARLHASDGPVRLWVSGFDFSCAAACACRMRHTHMQRASPAIARTVGTGRDRAAGGRAGPRHGCGAQKYHVSRTCNFLKRAYVSLCQSICPAA
ncbi:hypothetical protein BS78_02G193800 [Paspalum vaginatum]|nr:hypothetical protein BS78_02G193800 [Paspalum vaginatum]